MKTTIATIGLTMFTLFCTAVFAADKPSPEKVGKDEPLTAAMLAGTYTIVSAQKGDEMTPADRLEGCLVTFTENTIVTTDADKKQMYAATFKLNNTHTPAMIAMVSTTPEYKGAKANGLIHRDGSTVKLVYALPDEGEAPKELKAGKGQRYMVLERIEKTASVPSVRD
jgi:uncharacterized protein (TIGR03067 family)